MSAEPRPYRAAIIGTGRIASSLEQDPLRSKPHTHAGWYTHDPRTTLVAGCDIDAGRLADFGRYWQVEAPHLYGDYRDMLQEERPDIVSICAYATDRVAMCEAALQAGARALWIEKAVGCAVDEAERLARAVADAGAVAVVDHPRRLEGRYRAVARWLRDETFGRPETIHVVFSGHVVHTGTHAWDLLLGWCGPWVRVDATLDAAATGEAVATLGDGRAPGSTAAAVRASHDGAADRGGRARIVFASGVEAFVSGGAKGYFVFGCDIVCTRGRIRIGNDVFEVQQPADSSRYTGFLELAPADTTSLMHADDHRTTSVLGSLLSSLDDATPPLLSVRAATAALALGIAVMQAGLSGHTVTPATLDRTLRVASV